MRHTSFAHCYLPTFLSAAAIFAMAASAGAQSAVNLDGTSGTNTINSNFGFTNGIYLSLGFYVDYLVVGGGGGGGAALRGSYNGGGGGGGEFLSLSSQRVYQQNYSIAVGAGGTGGERNINSGSGTNGGNSTAFSQTALGGGGGGGIGAGASGGSGGGGGGVNNGAGGATTALLGYGNAGGQGGPNSNPWAGGGGGGAGAAGSPASSNSIGGIGRQSSITGTSLYYAGGGAGGRAGSTTAGGSGGGGSSVGDQVGGAGVANSGGGGGAGVLLSGTALANVSGGAGGSGLVVVRYQGSSVGNIGGTVTSGSNTATGYTLHTFTNIGNSAFNLSGVNMSSRLGATLTGNLSGAGTVYYSGPGTLTLTGNNNYSGQTFITGGTLQIGNGGMTGNIGSGSIVNNSSLIFNRADNITISNNIGGTGNLTKSGTGTLTLSGLSNTYAGGTFVTAGRLIGNATTLQRNIVNDAQLEFAQHNSGTYQGAISGTGLLVKSGGGTLTLGGANTHTGGTEIQAGVLATNGSNRLSGTGTMALNANATFRLGGNQTLASLSGAGNVELGNNSLTTGIISSAFSGTMSGNGDLNKSGAGTLTLSGNNTFLGDTNIQAGTLVLASAHALSNDAVVNLASGAKLTVNQRTFIGALDQGGGTINGTGELVTTLTQTSSGSLNAVLTDGTDFAAGILKRTYGTTTIGAANTFTGSIKVQSGMLQLDSSGSFSSASSLVTFNSGTMNLNNKSQTFSKISGSGGTIYLGTGNLTVNQSTSSEYGGSITGSGSVIKSSTGVLTLSAANTYTGNTIVDGGELKVNGSIASSEVMVNSNAVLSGSGTVGGISGAGSIDPGNSPGILTAPWIDPSDGMFLNFEITDIKPEYSQATNSSNDVLRLTAANPFAAAMDAGNEINVYFNVADFDLNQAFRGGIYTDSQAEFANLVSNATFNYYIQDDEGNVSYNGILYSALIGYDIELSTALETANFADGAISGRVMQFTIVPEPSSSLLALIAGGLVLTRRKRKS